MGRGKKFEAAVREAFEKNPNISIDRLPDPTGGYLGVRNICDFIVYKYPFQVYMECKVQQGNTLNFGGRITDTQWNGLLEKSKVPGVVAGVLVWFIDHDMTIFLRIQTLEMMRGGEGKKSFNIKDLGMYEHFILQGRKKRVFFEYNPIPFLKEIRAWASSYWQEVIRWG